MSKKIKKEVRAEEDQAFEELPIYTLPSNASKVMLWDSINPQGAFGLKEISELVGQFSYTKAYIDSLMVTVNSRLDALESSVALLNSKININTNCQFAPTLVDNLNIRIPLVEQTTSSGLINVNGQFVSPNPTGFLTVSVSGNVLCSSSSAVGTFFLWNVTKNLQIGTSIALGGQVSFGFGNAKNSGSTDFDKGDILEFRASKTGGANFTISSQFAISFRSYQ